MPSQAIEIENLTKEYPFGFLHLKKKTSLEGLNMQVEAGEVFGFIGPNGAGKSTTIKLLMGLIFPTTGSARILGKPISDVEMHLDIGYLPEQPYFYDYLTAAEVLDYFARFHDLTAADRKERVQRMLKKVGLETARKIQLRKYSKGMLQRVGLAQAILHDPKVVILDEPMSGLDPVGRRELRDIILELKREGKTVMFSTHILSDAEMLCDRVGVIVGGKLRGVGAPGALVDMKTQGMEILFEKHDDFFNKNPKAYSHRYLHLGVLYCYKGEVQKGRKAFRKSMSMNPFEMRNYFNFSLSLLGAERFKKLKKVKEKVFVQ